MIMRSFVLGSVLSLSVGAALMGSARADCLSTDKSVDFPDDSASKPVTLRGIVVQSADVPEGGDASRKYLAIALDNPICASGGHGGTDSHGNGPTDFGDLRMTLLKVTGIPAKWIGYSVIVSGKPASDVSLSVTRIEGATQQEGVNSVAPSVKATCKGAYLNALVVGLNPNGLNNLAVRAAPNKSSPEIDELVNDDVVCILGTVTPWDHIRYFRDGTNHTGWAHSKWIAKWGGSRFGD